MFVCVCMYVCFACVLEERNLKILVYTVARILAAEREGKMRFTIR